MRSLSKQSIYYAICKGDCDMLKKALIKNYQCTDNNKPYSLNNAIIIMLNNDLTSFNPEIINTLIDFGSKIDNDDMSNTLTFAICYGVQYYNRYRFTKFTTNRPGDIYIGDQAEENVLRLIRLLINQGGRSNSIKGYLNTFTVAIRSKNEEIIKLIAQTNPIPYNNNNNNNCYDHLMVDHNTLTYAVMTENLDIVKIACQYGAKPDTSSTCKNTFVKALKIGACPKIVEEILMVGGFAPSSYLNVGSHKTMLDPMSERRIYCNDKINLLEPYIHMGENNVCEINEILDLIMCSGSRLTLREVKTAGFYKIDDEIDLKIIDCYKLLNGTYHHLLDVSTTNESIPGDSPSQVELERINKLKLHLKNKMNQLFEKATNKINKNYAIEKASSIPPCCTDIIFEYQRDDGMTYIKW